jgi:hypothetical protein
MHADDADLAGPGEERVACPSYPAPACQLSGSISPDEPCVRPASAGRPQASLRALLSMCSSYLQDSSTKGRLLVNGRLCTMPGQGW